MQFIFYHTGIYPYLLSATLLYFYNNMSLCKSRCKNFEYNYSVYKQKYLFLSITVFTLLLIILNTL